ncbi:uncharacterized protein TrAFT101_006669 [Trichoderma asperellum]|uniref:uncharacterized protein n=1 Tax=Trichoderma asperellum TaxID=101201 RepID=UPI003325B3D1|nr:hypothetical protein TrAFT101_006669 [Trichoderma asperellum]
MVRWAKGSGGSRKMVKLGIVSFFPSANFTIAHPSHTATNYIKFHIYFNIHDKPNIIHYNEISVFGFVQHRDDLVVIEIFTQPTGCDGGFTVVPSDTDVLW